MKLQWNGFALFCYVTIIFIQKQTQVIKSNNNNTEIQQENTKENTVFTRVSALGAHLVLSSQRGTLIWGRRSFEGGAHWIYQRDIKILRTCVLNQTIKTVIITEE